MTTRLTIEPCIECGKPLDAATYLMDDAVKPKPGDISMCVYCGHLTAFDSKLHRRELTGQEMHDMAGDPRLLQMQAARAKVMKK